jgi:cysteine desulfurase
MSEPRSYLDWNATAPLRPEARAAMLAAFDCIGNASSPHWEGRRALSLVEGARESLAAAFGVDPSRVYFTSGATEAANWLLAPQVAVPTRRAPLELLLLGASEHACLLEGHRFPAAQVETIPVDGNGLIELDWLERRLEVAAARHGPGAVMVAVQVANNETGVLQPLAALAALLAERAAVGVWDAVQAVGRLPLTAAAFGNGLLFLSGHKLGGPKGVGAVILAGADLRLAPLLRGGGQERRQRSGTENIAGIVGLAAAVRAAISELEATAAHGRALQRRFEAGLKRLSGDAVIFGEAAPRLANTSAFALPGIAAETALIALDLAGVAVSSGSACSSGKVARSHVLEAMRVEPALASCALRVSSGRTSSAPEIDHCLEALQTIVEGRGRRQRSRPPSRQRQVA